MFLRQFELMLRQISIMHHSKAKSISISFKKKQQKINKVLLSKRIRSIMVDVAVAQSMHVATVIRVKSMI